MAFRDRLEVVLRGDGLRPQRFRLLADRGDVIAVLDGGHQQ